MVVGANKHHHHHWRLFVLGYTTAEGQQKSESFCQLAEVASGFMVASHRG